MNTLNLRTKKNRFSKEDRLVFKTNTPSETRRIANELGKELKKSLRDIGKITIAIHGDLGAGKTVFVQGLARGMGITAKIISPTFVLARKYQTKSGVNLIHIDAYRIEKPNEASIVTGKFLESSPAVVCVEWPEKMGKLIKADIVVSIEHGDGNRSIIITTA